MLTDQNSYNLNRGLVKMCVTALSDNSVQSLNINSDFDTVLIFDTVCIFWKCYIHKVFFTYLIVTEIKLLQSMQMLHKKP